VVVAEVHRDPVEPGAEGGATVEAVERLPGLEEGLLGQVLGRVGADQPGGQPVDGVLVGVDQLGERRRVALSRLLNQLTVARVPASSLAYRPVQCMRRRAGRNLPAAVGLAEVGVTMVRGLVGWLPSLLTTDRSGDRSGSECRLERSTLFAVS
jgi:hypothetical protein